MSLRLSHEGAAVVIADVDEAGGRETARQVEAASGRATFARCDVAVESDVRALFERAGADVVVNCASAPYRPGAPMEYWLTTVEEIAGAVLLLATDDSLAGRVMVWWSGQPRSLIPAGDPGYVSLEPR